MVLEKRRSTKMSKTITYKRLWKLLIDKNMTKGDLKAKTGISTASIAKLGKGENITTGVLIKICEGLNCELTDIMELENVEDMTSSEVMNLSLNNKNTDEATCDEKN